MTDMAVYLNGQRVPEIASVEYSTTPEATPALGLGPRRSNFEVAFSLTCGDMGKLWRAIEHLWPRRKWKKDGVAYRRRIRQHLVRLVGTAGLARGELRPDQRKYLAALGVRIPRRLR